MSNLVKMPYRVVITPLAQQRIAGRLGELLDEFRSSDRQSRGERWLVRDGIGVDEYCPGKCVVVYVVGAEPRVMWWANE